MCNDWFKTQRRRKREENELRVVDLVVVVLVVVLVVVVGLGVVGVVVGSTVAMVTGPEMDRSTPCQYNQCIL